MTTASAHSYEALAEQVAYSTTAPETEFLGTMPWRLPLTWFGRQGVCARTLGNPCVVRLTLMESANEDGEGSRSLRRTHLGKEFGALHVEIFDRQNGQTISQDFRLRDYLPEKSEEQLEERNGRPRLLLVRIERTEDRFSLRWVNDEKTTFVDMVPVCRAIEGFIDLLGFAADSQTPQEPTPPEERRATAIAPRAEDDGLLVITDDE